MNSIELSDVFNKFKNNILHRLFITFKMNIPNVITISKPTRLNNKIEIIFDNNITLIITNNLFIILYTKIINKGTINLERCAF
jgi:hypothetical protein